MAIQAWCNECRTTTVCVDAYEDGVPKGKFLNPYVGQWVPFHSLTQFLIKMENLMDEMAFPRAFTEYRSFVPITPISGEMVDCQTSQGEIATFAIHILFRQNASWQGSVTWMEGWQKERFRSVLELILLVNNALACGKAE